MYFLMPFVINQLFNAPRNKIKIGKDTANFPLAAIVNMIYNEPDA